MADDSSKNFKRLIVLCDGTADDSTANNTTAYPTNVTRISRAISQEATLDDGSKVQQIIYYQPGVGTSPTDKLTGGVYGQGLSANVRGAYGFLAHNYDPGDKIYFFGFSRGAYTARAIAGLVTYMGLLTKRGMDSFPQVYDAYYKHAGDGKTAPQLPPSLTDTLLKTNQLQPSARDAIEIIGVWDTVGFHGGKIGGEEIEFYNETLSPRVKHGYHALSLDENRLAFQPTLWQLPSPPNPAQEMIQVWFSGAHSDVGGGYADHHLSDIALIWMLAQCSRENKLQFDSSYLFDDSAPPPGPKWDTAIGPTNTAKGTSTWGSIVSGIEHVVEGKGLGERKPFTESGATNEYVHLSVNDRDLKKWPCPPLKAVTPLKGAVVKSNGKVLPDTTVDSGGIEEKYRGRVRGVVPIVPTN